MVDARAAKDARRLASTCRLLADARNDGAPVSEAWKAEWLAGNDQAAALVAAGARSNDALSGHDEPPLSRQDTRSFDIAALLDDDRPTRVVGPIPIDIDIDLDFDLEDAIPLDDADILAADDDEDDGPPARIWLRAQDCP
jgi:hypothetical protein